MFSVTYTGMNLFPLCTASVCPTKSGVMVLRRDQVLKTFFSFFSFRAWILRSSDSSTYGPFLILRAITYLRSLLRIGDCGLRIADSLPAAQSAIHNPKSAITVSRARACVPEQ